jgi:sensor histidine kinase regulating citrate/malate metabolism
MLVIALSLFTSNTPFFGIISGVILIAYLFYVEYMGKNEISYSKNDTSELNETSLYMRIIEENYQKSRELWHDLNNHIVSMRSLVDNKEYADLEVYINSLSEKIADNAFPIKSGNIILDALIADKYRIAKKHGIFVEFESIDYRNIIEAEDLCVIVGNLFDNAIEGNVRSICNEDRYIKLRISSVSDSLIITLKNPLFHELVVKSGLPVYSQARFRPSWHGT